VTGRRTLQARPALATRVSSQVSLDQPLLAAFTADALAGNRVAFRVGASRLTSAFTVLLIAVAAYSLTRSLPGLV